LECQQSQFACNDTNNTPECAAWLESSPQAEEAKPLFFKLNFSIPGSDKFNAGKEIEITGATLGEYIAALYVFLVGVGGILATIMMMWGGLRYVASGGSPQRISGAKDQITAALSGLIILLASYLLLLTINPNLVKFEGLSGVRPVKQILQGLETKSGSAKGAPPESDTIVPIGKEIAAETRLLCFDEFQVTNIADAMILGRLFETLFEEGITVFATSNRAPDDLYKNGLQRDRFLPFIELVEQRLEVLELGGSQDYRMGRLRELDLYLTPLGRWATTKLDEAFRALSNGADGEPRVLRVGGTDWITVSGCRTGACATHAGVLLVRGDGAALLARLDDGGFSHDYAFGTGLVVTPEVQLHVDAAWRALGEPPRSR